MKNIKYFILALPLAALMASCEKHDLSFADSDSTEGEALYQICYPRPVAVNTANGLDSLFLDGKKISGVGGRGMLAVNGYTPGSNRHFTTSVGTHKLVAYKSNNIVFEQDVTLEKGKQRVFIHNLDAAPVVIKDIYPLSPLHADGARPAERTFDSDSVARVRLYNFLYNGSTPYAGKLQYQWSNNSDGKYIIGDWHNLGEPVGFGEATEYGEIIIHKTVNNSTGYQTIRFRCLDEQGNQVAKLNDYWTQYIGRFSSHIMRGTLTGTCGYTQLTDNV